jgi:hypothetical protein
MPLSPSRSIRVVRHAVSHDGIDDYTVIEPFEVYGWSEITIEELIYPFHPKPFTGYTVFSMIGDEWVDMPATRLAASPGSDYTWMVASWIVRRPDGTHYTYEYNFFAWRNTWVQVVRRFTSTREYSVWINAEKKHSKVVPGEEKTVLEWNPDTATYPTRYRRFVLGAGTILSYWMKDSYAYLRIYSRALEQWEIEHNYLYPYDPVKKGLEVYLLAHPNYIADIDGDGVLEWIDLSGKGRHAKLYGATLVELIKPPAR